MTRLPQASTQLLVWQQGISKWLKTNLKPISLYWTVYGGWKGFFGSLYLWMAVTMSALLSPLWLKVADDGSRPWTELPLSIVPNILGFSMGGMAIVLAFASTNFFKHITNNGDDNSYFMKSVASFYHFIFVQTASIFLALIGKVHHNTIISAIGFTSFCYALTIALATASQLFNTARIANVAPSDDIDDHVT